MKLTVKTSILQELMLKATKGASCNKLSAITNYVSITHKDNVLSMTTTNGTNFLKVSQKDVPGTGFNVVADISVLSKLVLKTTSETISMEVVDSNLVVTGNGKYDIALPLDVDGEFVNYPNIETELYNPNWTTLSMDGIRSALATNKSSLATDLGLPWLTAYYFCKDRIMSSNSYVVCVNKVKTMEAEGLLLFSEFVELVGIITDKTANVVVEGDTILVKTDTIYISGKLFPDVEKFPINDINTFLGTEFLNTCIVDKSKVLEAIDRLLLFVDPTYDENGIYLNFEPTGLTMYNKKSKASETIKYEEKGDNIPFVCLVNVTTLKNQLNAQPTDKIQICFGAEAAIKLSSDSVIQIIALYGEDDSSMTHISEQEDVQGEGE